VSPLAKRILAALAAIPVVFGLIFWPWALPFKIVTVVVLLLGLLEFYQMTKVQGMHPLTKRGSSVLLLILLPAFLKGNSPVGLQESLLLGLLFLSLTLLGSSRPLREMVTTVSVTFFGALYFGLLGSYFFALREMENGSWHLFWLCAATWAYDTGGYSVGKKWGRHRMTPEVSPKKSWEGTAGGLLFCLGVLFLFWKVFPVCSQLYSLADVAITGLLLSLFGQLGDLVESMIKRSSSVKDSGDFFPGHGGIFDRIDSLLFNAPVLFYYLTVFKKILEGLWH